jgi:hypothetical protein
MLVLGVGSKKSSFEEQSNSKKKLNYFMSKHTSVKKS